ncbi:methyltransferase domain-containing protein [Cobetia crustatorum]|uniref:methyltransferase domain-containing protein n=1 Tax=Cobetia crustatorum TaxID=553385 RepID=UPI00046A2B49|nr:methyltransferase domain-containing protein [Cobetia crustatorum]
MQTAHSLLSTTRTHIAKAFDRGAADYITLAQAQHVMARMLFDALPVYLPARSRVLDIGCGPGHWTQALTARYPVAHCLGLDLSMAMLQEAARTADNDNISWLRGDAERLPLANDSFDLVFSSLAVQWCDRPEKWLSEIARILRPGGKAFINTLGPGTLSEVRHAWQRDDDSVRHFPSAETLVTLATSADLICEWDMRQHVFHYPDFARVMDSIKRIGAQTASGRRLLRADLQHARSRHETLRTEKGLPVSYHVIELTLEKPVNNDNEIQRKFA